jgi:Tfp pilus assembly protein FimT
MRRQETGLSALELAVIILVIGIVASIAIPNVVAASRAYKLNMAATALAQHLNLCRQKAVRSNLPTTLRITGTSVDVDINHDDAFDSADGPSQPVTSDTRIAISTQTVQNSTLGNGKVQFSSRGDIPVGDTAPAFRVTMGTRYRDVTVDNRGAVTVGPEL